MSRVPKNYLARAEQRRIFWRFMPLAILAVLLLGWIEQTWFRPPVPPPPPQVDTRVEHPLADAAVADAVRIEREAERFSAEEGALLGASPAALDRVRDDTVFRADESDAWFEIWTTLRDDGPPPTEATRQVSFTELFGQPRSFRGRPVAMAGTLRRLERVRAPVNDVGIEGYWQGWLEPEGGPASPVVVYFLEIPAGMPEGSAIAAWVDVRGYFFKRWAYAAKDTVRRAPLIMAAAPGWTPPPAGREGADSIGLIALATMAALTILTMLGIRLAGQGWRRPPPPPPDVASALSGHDIVSTEESLRRLAESDRRKETS